MNKIKSVVNVLLILLLPVNIVLILLAANNPSIIESYYSNCINKLLIEKLSSLSNTFKFSLAEIIIVITALLVTIVLISLLFKKTKYNTQRFKKHNTAKKIEDRHQSNYTIEYYRSHSFQHPANPKSIHLILPIKLLCICNLLYFIFLILWGFNYYRKPVSMLMKINVRSVTKDELIDFCSNTLKRANIYSNVLSRDNNGNIIAGDLYDNIFVNTASAFNTSSYDFLKGSYSVPKPVLLSPLLSYTGITGFYFPFTCEANVNTSVPFCTIPFTACHEAAHQHGFAREDEANFIAYIICTHTHNQLFIYSGYFTALLYCMNALYDTDKMAYYKITKEYSVNLVHDIKQYNNYWQNHEGVIETISNKINDVYLKFNNQKSGIITYDYMVNLLLAYQRKFIQNN